ncbi:uncharacterized protein BYT42DRAFT_574794 [Radiomyces spectabilis]|uniref:uncharacterized protein n=1 Tax=Radiomyces spectabilis TaxID=64574 RepID=UPI00222088BB|nr:uncharacterized protein BYT42DRAFT_574794 [Radiomyces spectabilis]KAI8376487.1 hypothetical protein BYT42DRAFT_574794 [Radiomyces spectabilis]
MSLRPEFGVSSSKFNRGRGRGRRAGYNRPTSSTAFQKYGLPSSSSTTDPTNLDQRFDDIRALDELESRFGFEKYQDGPERLGWLINMHATIIEDDDWPGGRAGVNYYFINENGETFKSTLTYSPYFYIGCKRGTEAEVEEFLRRKFETTIESVKRVQKEDLKQHNHLIGNSRTFIQLNFRNVSDLLTVRKFILPLVKKNQAKINAADTYADVVNEANNIQYDHESHLASMSSRRSTQDALDNIIDIREYDIPYYARVAIDLDIRVGLWYTVKALPDGTVSLSRRSDLVHRPEPVILAFDIETTKLPLKFPDASIDQIMMISYMIDGRGYLITNREIVSQDIEDFEYTPKPDFEGPFTIFNESDELSVLRRFFEHIQDAKPSIYVTYNGDFFDWPFVEARAKIHGLDMYQEIGVYKDEEDEYKCKHASHMDAFRWVKRDSYLPQGSQGLKAVTTAKLGYNPMELDPEDMTPFAAERPQLLAQYSVSDAVATYYLYMKYVHPFIFSLCNIIPLIPDEVLRKGSGTLCELLLMVEAYKVNVIMPNKHTEETGKIFEGHLLESETYVGGHVEALEAGVFRSDIASDFKIEPEAAQQLIDQLEDALKFTIQVEEKKSVDDIANYDEVRDAIKAKLEDLRDRPIRHEPPFIYHLDVAAMYPNIILTNRLQPDAMIDESMCATCEFNRPGKTCDRRMTWTWRGEFFPAKRNEHKMIHNQLTQETFPPKVPNGAPRPWHELSEAEQTTLLHKRLTDYCKRVYKKVRETKTMERESIICQRENPFYIETVRAFRDRRYEYKGLHKKWKQNLDQANSEGSVTKVAEAKNMIVLYDSLQLAHKCILNSFYGYVMRKGARWHSLEMAGIVCLTGAKIIQMARQLVERIGRPLELDTDGIWCILPKSFPETFKFQLKNGKSFKIDYPCTMLNHLVHAKFTNHQYQTLTNKDTFDYSVHSENSIFFEIDGPYRAMILPSSTVEDKLLKKRYAVFNEDGSLAELKGFEVKRRGELKLIKIFQSEIFKVFLDGSNLEECYAAVAKVANRWLDVLYSKAANLNDDELFDLISENRSMSKTLEDYGSQKSTAISTAKRLAEFLGDQMVKDKGLACKFIISARPYDLPVSERAIPVAIFSAESSVKKHFLRKWLKDNALVDFDIRTILDWPYYLERFGSVIQKLITIPAAMQKVLNPVPRVRHPDWLYNRVAAKDDKFKQYRITDLFTKVDKASPTLAADDTSETTKNGNDANEQSIDIEMQDIEELGVGNQASAVHMSKVAKLVKRRRQTADMEVDEEEAPLAEEDLPANMPDMHTDYGAWLQYQKRKWERQRVARLKRRKANQSSRLHDRSDVSGYFRRQTGSLVASRWDILHIAETDVQGEYRLWVVIQGRLHNVKLRVPRTFYVNSREEDSTEILRESPSCEITKCVRTLPRSHPCINLFHISMDEKDFQAEQKKFSSIFSHPSTEGVYETQIPLHIRAVLQLGTSCEVAKEIAVRKSLDDYFDLSDLTPRTDSINSYVLQPKDFHFLYLYHVNCDNRHVFALVGAALDQCHVFIVGTNQRNHQMPNINRLYKAKYEETWNENADSKASDTVQYKPDLDFAVSYHESERVVFRAVNKILRKYQDQKKGQTVIAISSPRNSAYIVQQVRILNEFPYLKTPSLQQDNKFDALNWLQPAIKRMLHSYIELGTWINERLGQARYANVPFCNLPDDAYLFMADVFLSRRLISSDMVLWWSPANKPDLGGREEDENTFMMNELVNTELNHPDVYENVCVEIDLMRLCLNSILEAPIINELEGTSGSTGFDNTIHTLDDYSKGIVHNTASFGDGMVTGKTFSMLRSTVQKWFYEAVAQDNKLGEMMLDTLHRWLSSSTSNMYDPSLYGVIHGMMKKVFMQLLAEFKRLGAKIVFANFYKIMLSTSKETIESAQPYCEYLYRSIQHKQIFEVLDLSSVDYWDMLVWMDEMNYGGILVDNGGGNKRGSGSTVHMQWNIQDYLPPIVQDMFKKVIGAYIYKMHQSKREFPRSITADIQKADSTMPDPRSEKLQDFIRHNIMRKILQWIPDIVARQNDHLVQAGSELAFPQLPGSHLTLSNPALEFTKSVCAVMSLDSRVEDQVRVLKRSVLEAIGGLSDFSAEAQFRNPCEYYKLTEVICTYCNYTTDLDFCRDRRLMSENGQLQPWRCRGCHLEYDKTLIEDRMISEVQRWLASYQLQDLVCTRCRSIKKENLMKQCDKCGSEYMPVQNKSELARKLGVFKNVGREQNLVLLLEIVNWSLQRL